VAYRFLRALRDWARLRTTFLVVFAVIGFVVASVVGASGVVNRPCDPTHPPYLPCVAMAIDSADVMSPDGLIVNPGGTATGGTTTIAYRASRIGSFYVVKRNGVPWLSISNVNGVVQIKDPNGAPSVVVIKAPAKAR
jgi:hypothetical protein